MKVIFMGTPDFAVPTLNALINSSDHQVSAVFTAAPKLQGRGLKQLNSPVHELALKHQIPIHTPSTLRNEEAARLISSIEADIIVVVAYGFIIPPTILHAKKHGCVNVHPSDLPKYRGAAPLQRTIINGEKETAVCIIQMDEGVDTGDIILKEKFDLSSRITLPELHDTCAKIGAKLLLQTLDQITDLPKIKQSHDGSSYAKKLTKEEGRVNWQESAWQIDCRIRGMNPWPGVFFEYDGKIIKILEAQSQNFAGDKSKIMLEAEEGGDDFLAQDFGISPGTVLDDELTVACGQGRLLIRKLQQEGKKPLSTQEFLRGFLLPVGTRL